MYSFRKSSTWGLRGLSSLYHKPRSFAYKIISKSSQGQYQQIPEHLKIHMFANELSIIKDDELKGPFKNFSPEFIVTLLNMRVNEIRLETNNSNPSSRITSANITRIMKLTFRLKKLFKINGGNTEVLDAVLNSQSQLDLLELKLAAKKTASTSLGKDNVLRESSQSPEYLQIPDDIKIHEFVDLLKEVQLTEIKAPFASVNATNVIEAVDRRIKACEDDSNVAKEKLHSYQILRSRLQRLFNMNGAYTFILDTVMNSQRMFDKFESNLQSRRLANSAKTSEYKQLPDDFPIEEFAEELNLVRAKLGSNFSTITSTGVLEACESLIESESSPATRSRLEKLKSNLRVLFRHNNNATFILDNVLSSTKIFKQFENKLEEKRYAGLIGESSEPRKYRDADQILPLLESQNSFYDGGFLEQDLKISTAVMEAMSREEQMLSHADPEEYERLQNLTPESIRESYPKRFEETATPPEKEKIETFLKETKRNKDSFEETKWREREAYEWSSNVYLKHRSLEARNFFNPIFMERQSYSFPMFPSRDKNQEYLILHTNGQQLTSAQNPLGINHVPENVLRIFEKIPENDLPAVLDSVSRLKKKNWMLIGSGKNGTMLILSRNKQKKLSLFLSFLKSALFATGVVLVLSIMDAQRKIKEAHEHEGETSADTNENTSQETDSAGNSGSFWKRLFWLS